MYFVVLNFNKCARDITSHIRIWQNETAQMPCSTNQCECTFMRSWTMLSPDEIESRFSLEHNSFFSYFHHLVLYSVRYIYIIFFSHFLIVSFQFRVLSLKVIFYREWCLLHYTLCCCCLRESILFFSFVAVMHAISLILLSQQHSEREKDNSKLERKTWWKFSNK